MSTLGQIPINRVAELVTVNLNLKLILLLSLYIVQHFRVHVEPTISEPPPESDERYRCHGNASPCGKLTFNGGSRKHEKAQHEYKNTYKPWK